MLLEIGFATTCSFFRLINLLLLIGTGVSQFQNHAGQPYGIIRAIWHYQDSKFHVYPTTYEGIGAGVGSSGAVLLLAVMVVLITTAVVKSKKAGNVILAKNDYCLSSVYYIILNFFVVNNEESNSIEMKENAAYERPPPTQLKIDFKENSAYGVVDRC